MIRIAVLLLACAVVLPLHAQIPLKTRAQELVEQTVAKHPDLTVLALRASTGAGKEMVVLGSTFGRHGKKADAGDLKVLNSGEVDAGLHSGGKRFGATLPLRDAAGK